MKDAMLNSVPDAVPVISDTAALERACARLAEAPFVTVDTEFMRETTYWPKLCLIQVAGPDLAAVIDPKAPGISLDPFFALMADARVIKVFHAARQDIEIIFHLARVIPKPLFDTQVAAMVCGFGESVSYSALVKQITGRNHDKTSRFTDWDRRPLSDQQLRYAIGDVTHLRDVYLKLTEQLQRAGRAHWLNDEMALLENPATYETVPEEAWQRLKVRLRSPLAMAIVIEAAAWRERLAQRQDVPRSRILKDEAIYDLAAQAPRTVEDLAKLRSFRDGSARSARGRELVEVVVRALARDPATIPAVAQGHSLGASDAAVADLLRVLLKAVAARHGVAPRLIAGSDDLERIAMSGETADTPALTGWRRELFGDAALALKAGKLALTMRDGEVVAAPIG
ncbi:MAG: ribonuclease D [Hyphomicrobiales bacterium]|nr:ribonuclease D [Hyphomicrobiales bacterium]